MGVCFGYALLLLCVVLLLSIARVFGLAGGFVCAGGLIWFAVLLGVWIVWLDLSYFSFVFVVSRGLWLRSFGLGCVLGCFALGWVVFVAC